MNWSTSTEYCDENCQKKTIQAADGPEWTTVPGNSMLDTSDFQVMKYQAHILGHSAHVHEPIVCNTSTNNCVLTKSSINTPWLALVSRSMAYDMCAAIGAHLITNEEWMTIIRNVENVDDNWLGGAVAQGHLKTSSSSFILSNGETVSDLLSNYEEHINSYIVPSEGQWPTLISDDSCDDNYYTSWGNDCLTYNRYSSTQLYYPYNAIGNWGTLDSNKFLPGYYATGTITSRDVGYGAIQLSKNAPTMQYYLLRNGYEDSSNYHYGNKGLLQLKFLSSEAAYQAAFRCVRDITP